MLSNIYHSNYQPEHPLIPAIEPLPFTFAIFRLFILHNLYYATVVPRLRINIETTFNCLITHPVNSRTRSVSHYGDVGTNIILI